MQGLLRRVVLTASFMICAVMVMAQTGDIRGFVYDKDNGEPIMFATVYLVGTNYGTTTDLEGFYNISGVEAGEYTVAVTYIGYDSVGAEITIPAGGLVNQSLYTGESQVTLGEIVVSAEAEEARSDVKISQISVTPKEIKAIPAVGGEADIATYLQVLPGVVSTGDQGGQIYIRGGSPVQNKIMIDGMTIYNPFHSIGFFSVFETEAVRQVDVLTGGFNAENGGRISAVVDITSRDGNKKRYGGLVSANPFLGKVLLEGPISKLKDDGGGSSSFILTAKHSYIDRTSPALYDYASDAGNNGLPYSFTDIYGKVSFSGGTGSKFNLFGFNHRDRVEFSEIADLGWDAFGGGANFKLVPGRSKIIVGGQFSYTDYDISIIEGDDAPPRSSGISGFNAGFDFNYYLKNSELKYGFEVNGFSTELEFTNFVGNTINLTENTTELAGFFNFKTNIKDRLIIEPSMRLQYYASLSEFSFEPRLGLKYNATKKLRFKAAGGLYSQNLISTVNERDVVNLFVGFLSAPEQIQNLNEDGVRTESRLQKAVHAVAGVEIDLMKGLSLNIEPYYKGYGQLINLNRNKTEPSDPNFSSEEGKAYGIDFLVQYRRKSLSLWLAYSLGYVDRFDGEQTYPTLFDRRHNANVVASYQFGKAKDWEAGLRWNLGSGFPFTLTQGFYEDVSIDNGIGSNVVGGNGNVGIIFDENRNAGRLPYYHRLDLSLKKSFEFGKHSRLELVGSVTNAYNRENIFYFDRVSYSRVNQLPILPSLGATFFF